VIRSFRCKDTQRLFNNQSVRPFRAIEQPAREKLLMIDAAVSVSDLKTPPGNCLEHLKGSRKGSYSIRINRQWRICFTWKDGHAHDVEIVDYH